MTRFAALVAFLLTGAAQAQNDGAYRLETGDTIGVSVLEDPALNQTALIRPDGLISLPLVGAVQAAGLTPEELAASIRRALSRDFVTAPSVNVALISIGDPNDAIVRFYALGQVARPGLYEVDGSISALQALAVAGGLGVFADTSRIQIRRTENGAQQVMLFDYDALEDGAVPTLDLQLREGDVIVVPERGLFD